MSNPPTTVLNARQQRFVEEYLIDLNATQAAIRAGYSPKTARSQGQRLLTNVDIASELTKARTSRAERVEVTQDYVLANSVEVVERCLQRAPVLEFDREKKQYVQATDADGNAIWTFDANGANKALALLAKHTGGFADRIDHTSGGKPIAGINVSLIRPAPGTEPHRLDAILASQHNGNGHNGNGSG